MSVKISQFPQVGEATFTDSLDSLRGGINVTTNPALELCLLNAGEAIAAGAAIYEDGGLYYNAVNSDPAKINVVGFSTTAVTSGNPVYGKRYGHITPISLDVSNSIDDVMYLSSVDGQLTKVMPTGVGESVVRVGILTAVTPALDLMIEVYPGLSSGGVTTFNAGTTGLTPNSDTSGAVTLGGIVNLAHGGTNSNLTASAGAVVYSGASGLSLSTIGTAGQALTSNGSSAPTWTDVLPAQMPPNAVKGNNTGSTGPALNLTQAEITAMINDFIGDSGSGGTKGLAPAPAAGDAALSKFLNADGTWKIPPSAFDATVGAGGNYPTWSAAYAAGKRNLVTVGNGTETANIVFNDSLSITMNPGVSYDLGDFNFQGNANGCSLTMDGTGEIVWSPTSSKAFVDGMGFQDITFIRGSLSLNGAGSTADNCSLYQGINSVVASGLTRINLPNRSNWGINLSNNNLCFEFGLIALLNINPTGPNINNIISGSAGIPVDMNQIVLVGSFDNTLPVINTTSTSYNSIKFLDIVGGQTLKLSIGGKLSGASLPFGGAFDITIASDGTQITNCNIGTGNINISGHADVKLINVNCNDVLNVNSSTALNTVNRFIDSVPFIRNIDIYNGLQPIVTSGGSQILTNESPEIILFTGTTTETLVLPDATELFDSKQYQIQNESTGIITINKNGGGLLTTVNGGSDIVITLKDNTTVDGIWHISATSGGGGTPGGTNGQIQYNNSGSFGGASITTDGTGTLQATNWEILNSGAGSLESLELANYLNLAQLTTAQRNAITPNAGMAVYNTDTAVLEYYGGSPLGWQPFPSGVLALQGNWDASTNTPTLTAGIGTNGFAYYVSVAGTQTLPSGVSTVYNVGDLVYYTTTSAIWNKLSGGSVVTVFGRTGPAITAQTGDYTISQITNGLSNVLPTNNFFVGNGSNVAVANTPTQATALLNAMVGDSGSGGTKGLVPAPAANDSVKFLKGDGNWGNVNSISSITTAGSSTVLTATSNNIQRFTGTSTQTLVLPNATTLDNGVQYQIQNESTSAITINRNDASLLYTLPAQSNTIVTLAANGTAAGTWNYMPVSTPNLPYVGDYKMSALTTNHGVWLRCDGTAVSRTTYSALFAKIGISFGAGDGSTTFNIPDFRGRVYGTVGSGTGLTPRLMGANVGVESVTLTSGQIPSHNHAFSNRYQGIGTSGSGANALVTSSSAFDGTSTVTPASFGSGASHENMQPTLFGGDIFICYSGL